MELLALKRLALDTVPFRTSDGAQRLTVIAKLTIDVHTGELVEPAPIRGDVLHEGGRSLRVASDYVPRKARADVTVAGTAHAPEVRLTVTPRVGAALIDKSLRILGAPVPLTYEHAFGGPGSRTNPVGTSAPTIVDPANEKRTAGLGPVPATWWWRSQLLGEHDFTAVDSLRAIPRELDFAFFNAAPPDQQTRFLSGDESVVLLGLERELRFTLPALRAYARFNDADVRLVADTLAIDADAGTASLTFRGDFAVEALVGRVVATLAPIGEEPSWGLPPELTRARGRSRTSAKHPARAAEDVPVINESHFVPFAMHFRVRPPRDAVIVIVKGTFDLVDGGPAKLASAQQPPLGDGRYSEGESLRYASDFVPFKPRADVFLVGHAYPGNESGVAHVHLQVEDTRRSMAVFGDRSWDSLGGQSSRAPFEKMELRWERALGGPLSHKNPVGRGHGTAVLLPNLERLDALITESSDTPDPICFAPIDPEWRVRRSRLGTYDARWLAKNWPYFPDDFDWSYFNAAQVQMPWLRGDERYALIGVTPGGGTLSGRLPAARPRVYAAMVDGRFVEIVLRIDTLHFDADTRQLTLVHRGLLETNDATASELAAVFVVDDANLTIEEVHDRFLARTKPASPPRPPPPAVELRAPPPKRKTIEGWLAANGLAGRDLSGGDLRNLDLTGRDLRGAILSRSDLRGSTLKGCNLDEVALAAVRADGVDFTGGTLARADLEGAILDNAQLSLTTLTHANLAGASCKGAQFDGAQGEAARFVGAALAGAVFDRAVLTAADFTRATVDGTSFVGCTLDDAKLYEARGAARFDRATLRDARLDNAELAGSSMLEIVADGLTGESVNLERANLLGARLKGALLIRACLRAAILSRADLRDAILRRADLTEAKLLRANAMGASFDAAILDRTDVRGANMYGVALPW